MKETNTNISIFKVLKQVMDTIKQTIEQEFKEMNITGTQGMLVGILSRHGEMKISDLSDRMGLSNSTVSGIIDRLEKQGIIERTRSEEDRRVVHVKLASGSDDTLNHFARIEQRIDSILSEATPEEVDKIFEGLGILKKLLEKQSNK